jgi:hypothetical protein
MLKYNRQEGMRDDISVKSGLSEAQKELEDAQKKLDKDRKK